MRLDDLMGSLKTFEMNTKKKNKCVGLKAKVFSKTEDDGDISE